MEELKERKTIRLENYDYNNCGVYFITICTKNRECLLSNIVNAEDENYGSAQVVLTEYGKTADKYLRQLNDFYDFLSVEHYVIMPNHIHILLFLKEHKSNGENGFDSADPRFERSGRMANTAFSKFISTFKRFCNKEYGKNIWQMRSYDHIIRNREDCEAHIRYIYENPINWYYDELFSIDEKR